MYRVLTVLSLCGFVFVGGCKKESEDKKDAEGGTALELTPTETISYLDTAVSSLTAEDDVSDTIAGAIETGLRLEGDSRQDADVPRCSETIGAWDEEINSQMDRANEKWPGREIYCKINGSPVSPEAVRGAYNSAKGIICELEKAGLLEFSEAGVEARLEFEPSGECFGDDFVEAITAEEEDGDILFDVSFTMKTLDGSNGWQQEITYEIEGETDSIYFVTSGTKVAVAKFSSDSGGWSLSLDSVDGILRYELNDPRYGRHVRLLGAGTIDVATGSLTDVNRIEGIYSGEGNIGTLAGTKDGGYKAFGYYSSLYNGSSQEAGTTGYEPVTYASFSGTVDTCYSSKCSGDGIPFDDEDYVDFVLFDDDMKLTAFGPLAFETVTFAAEPK